MAETVGAFLIRDGQVLLCLRSPHRRSYPNVWDVVGGHVEAGETHEAALVRELWEEIGVTATRFRFLTDLSLAGLGTCRFYRVEAWTPAEPFLANDEHVELRWFSTDEAQNLPNLALDAYRPLIRALDAG